MEEKPDNVLKRELPELEPESRPASWPIFVGTVIGAGVGMQLAIWIGKQLSGGLDLGGPIWTLTLTLSLVFGAMAGGLVADYVRKRR